MKLFANQIIFGNLYEFLFTEKLYDELIEIFMSQLPRQIKKQRVRNTENNSDAESQPNAEPMSRLIINSYNMELFTRALLLQVTSIS